MKDAMTISFPLNSEYLTTVRLTTGGIASLAGLDLDDSEDCKVCVTESLLILKRNGYSAAEIEFDLEAGLAVQITGKERTFDGEESMDDEISYALLEALVSNFAAKKEEGRIQSIGFTFGR